MVGNPAQSAGGDSADRLSRVADMLSNAVALLNEAMEEIKGEKGHDDDDGTTSGAPDRNAE